MLFRFKAFLVLNYEFSTAKKYLLALKLSHTLFTCYTEQGFLDLALIFLWHVTKISSKMDLNSTRFEQKCEIQMFHNPGKTENLVEN